MLCTVCRGRTPHVFQENVKKELNLTNIKVIAYLIVGSPEEEREDFEATIEWVKKHRDILLTSIILPYTINGVGNCNQTISAEELKWRLSELEEHNQMLVELKNEEHENKEYHIELCKDKIIWLNTEIEELKELIKECLEFLRML